MALPSSFPRLPVVKDLRPVHGHDSSHGREADSGASRRQAAPIRPELLPKAARDTGGGISPDKGTPSTAAGTAATPGGPAKNKPPPSARFLGVRRRHNHTAPWPRE